MDLQEKRKKKKLLSLMQPFAKKTIRNAILTDMVFEFITVIISMAMGYGSIPLDRVLVILAFGIAICLPFHALAFMMSSTTGPDVMADELEAFYNFETTARDRFKLLKQLSLIPSRLAASVFMISAACDILWLLVYSKLAYLDLNTMILIGTVMYVVTYSNCVYIIAEASHKVCFPYAADIVAKGIPKSLVDKNHSFGMPSVFLTVLLIFVPILLIGAMFFVFAWRAYASYTATNIVFFRLVWIGILAIAVYIFFAFTIFMRMMKSVNNIKNLLSGINKNNLHKVKKEQTDLSNEFMFNVYHINNIIDILQKILKKSQDISMEVIGSSNELSIISSDTAVTSQEQNSSVKNLLSAMEETDSLSKNIAEKIGEVSIVAKKTTENIGDGFEILKQNMQKLDEIKAANDITVDGIKQLTEKITGISDIARIINGIADQTNLIAFNAEIEASSAGEVGENFALVANEIRRLTNNTIQSTNEIRNRIIEIQHSSNMLLASSQKGSNKIIEETHIINKLNERFEELQHSSEAMDYASEDIKNIIDQQVAAFAQIVVTLRQISASSELFSNSTQKISESAQNLCIISDELKRFQPEDNAGESEAEVETASEVK